MSILITFLFSLFSLENIDCDKFYKENFDPINVRGVIVKKETTDDFYIISVKDDKKNIVKIKLLKNHSGFEIFTFSFINSDVLKIGGQRNIHIRVKHLDGSLTGRIFDKFCY